MKEQVQLHVTCTVREVRGEGVGEHESSYPALLSARCIFPLNFPTIPMKVFL